MLNIIFIICDNKICNFSDLHMFDHSLAKAYLMLQQNLEHFIFTVYLLFCRNLRRCPWSSFVNFVWSTWKVKNVLKDTWWVFSYFCFNFYIWKSVCITNSSGHELWIFAQFKMLNIFSGQVLVTTPSGKWDLQETKYFILWNWRQETQSKFSTLQA